MSGDQHWLMCESCQEEGQCRRLTCDHIFCESCIKNIVFSAMKYRYLMPPKCCRIDLDAFLIHDVLTVDEYEKYVEKREECNIKCMKCDKEFDDDQIVEGKVIECKWCETRQCKMCKKIFPALKSWSSEETDMCFCQDEDESEVLELMKSMKWKRCWKCGHIVGITEGCDHMECLCGFQFCYSCGKRWITCECSHETRYIVRPHHQEVNFKTCISPFRPVLQKCLMKRHLKEPRIFNIMKIRNESINLEPFPKNGHVTCQIPHADWWKIRQSYIRKMEESTSSTGPKRFNTSLVILWICAIIGYLMVCIGVCFSYLMRTITLVFIYPGILLFCVSIGGIIVHIYIYDSSKYNLGFQMALVWIGVVLHLIFSTIFLILSIVYVKVFGEALLISNIPIIFIAIIMVFLGLFVTTKFLTFNPDYINTDDEQLRKRISVSGSMIVLMCMGEVAQFLYFFLQQHSSLMSYCPVVFGIFCIFISIGGFAINANQTITTKNDQYTRLLRLEIAFVWICFLVHLLIGIVIGIVLVIIPTNPIIEFIFLYLPFNIFFIILYAMIGIYSSIFSCILLSLRSSAKRKTSTTSLTSPEQVPEERKDTIYEEI